jgi:hypothetical protein
MGLPGGRGNSIGGVILAWQSACLLTTRWIASHHRDGERLLGVDGYAAWPSSTSVGVRRAVGSAYLEDVAEGSG